MIVRTVKAALFSETSVSTYKATQCHSPKNTRIPKILQQLQLTLAIYSRATNEEASWLLAPTTNGTFLNVPARKRSIGSPGRNGSGLRKDCRSAQGANIASCKKSGTCRTQRHTQSTRYAALCMRSEHFCTRSQRVSNCQQTKTQIGMCPRANYTDIAASACRRS
jgi:hypothetical protein